MRKRRIDGGAALCALAFAACVLMTARYLIAGYGAYLDSDMASELALAQHLARRGALVSRAWHYSTEVRVLSTQLVFTPLMALFPHDWRLVRTAGCLILLAALSASAYASARWMGAARRYALLFAGLTLCPCSVVYAQMIDIGAYYVPHAVLTNLFVGLWAREAGTPGHIAPGRIAPGRIVSGRRAASCAALLALAFAMGAQSIRYLLCAVLPAAAAALASLFLEREARCGANRARVARLALTLAALACALAGYAAGKRLLSGFHVTEGYGAPRLTNVTSADLPGRLSLSLAWLLRLCGYTEGALLLSAHGVLSVAGMLCPAVAGLLLFRAQWRAAREGLCAPLMGALAELAAFALLLGSFLFVDGLFLNRYWLPVLTLGAPALAAALTLEERPALRRGAAALLSVVALGMGLCVTRDSMAAPERGEADAAVAQAIEDTGMTLGYATFWNANIYTELTGGEVEIVSMRVAGDGGGQGVPELEAWLEAEENLAMSRPDEGVFLLLQSGEEQALGAFLARCGARRAQLEKGLSLWTVESQRLFFEAMDAMKN